MKVIFSKVFKINIIFLTVILATSCNKNSDLVVEYVLSEDLHKEKLDGLAIDEFSRTNTDQGAVLDIMVEGSFSD